MEIKSKMPGNIIELKVKAGDKIEKGAVAIVMEALKMKQDICVQQAGEVKEVKISLGDRVNPGQVLLVVE